MQHSTTSQPAALELACPPIPTVRIAIVGVGQRGIKTIARYAHIDHAEIVAIADLTGEQFPKAQALLADTGRPTAATYVGRDAARSVCALPYVDVVMICTDWFSHTPIALMAMEAGKHVAVEVPAAMSMAECIRLIETAERTRRHCFMLENCCFDPFALSTLHIARQGLLGSIKHCEGAYHHNLYITAEGKTDPVYHWMRGNYPYSGGNAYPTHGIGPIAHLLNIHRGDRFTELYSISSTPHSELPQRVCTVMLRTMSGRTVMLQLDVHTPRPYSRLQTVCGTEGYASKYPLPTLRLSGMTTEAVGEEALTLAKTHEHPSAAPFMAEALRKGVENEMNYIMDARFIYCLRHGLPLDIDVYDAAEWSCVNHLSAISEERNAPVPFPDFTQGRWNVLREHTLYI